jgi:hypothetical protein
LYIVPSGTHNDTWIVGGETYKERLIKFMKDNTKGAVAKLQKPEKKKRTSKEDSKLISEDTYESLSEL